MRRFAPAEKAFSRLIDRVPDDPMIKVEREFFVTYFRIGNYKTVLSAIAALPPSLTGDPQILTYRLNYLLLDGDLVQSNPHGGTTQRSRVHILRLCVRADARGLLYARADGAPCKCRGGFALAVYRAGY